MAKAVDRSGAEASGAAPPLAAAIESFEQTEHTDRLALLRLTVRVLSPPAVRADLVRLGLRTPAGVRRFSALPTDGDDRPREELRPSFVVPLELMAAATADLVLELGDGRVLTLPWPAGSLVPPPPNSRRRPRRFTRSRD